MLKQIDYIQILLACKPFALFLTLTRSWFPLICMRVRDYYEAAA